MSTSNPRPTAREPRVLLVHGFPGGSSDFGLLTEELVARDWAADQILAPDLIGFGALAGQYAFEQLWVPAQVEGLAARVAPGEAGLVIVGHDVGGPIALGLAQRMAPHVRGLVLVSCNLLADPPLPVPFRLLRVPGASVAVKAVTMSRPSLRAMAHFGRRHGPTARPSTRAEARAIRAIFATALADPARHFGPTQQALETYAGPITHVIGDRDPFFDVEQARAQAVLGRKSRLEVLDSVGHFPHLEAPARLADVVESAARATPWTPSSTAFQ